MRNYLKYFIIITFGYLQTLQAQNEPKPENYLPNIIPPSPEAYKLGTYGNAPIGLFTGTPEINIPILTYREIPFSLSYTTAGIKVDDTNSKVGLGWNFLGVGVINRVIRDVPDDLFDDYPEKHLSIQDIEQQNPILNTYFNVHGENPNYDTEKDIFSLSFKNINCKFYFDNNNNIIKIDKSSIIIEPYYNTGDLYYNFLVTDTEGVKYYFEDTEQTMQRTSGEGHPEPNLNYTAWYISRVEYPNGEIIYFEYDNFNEYFVLSTSQQLSKASEPIMQPCLGGPLYVKPATLSPLNYHHMRILGKRIKNVYSNNLSFGKITFNYSVQGNTTLEPMTVLHDITLKNNSNIILEKATFSYFTTSNNRIFLQEVSFLDTTKKYSFEYINPSSFPSRLSKSQDHWGYFNGVNNTTLIPNIIGYGFEHSNYVRANRNINPLYSKTALLNKIIYPTKGWTELYYESNNCKSTSPTYILPTQKQNTLVVNTDENTFNSEVTFTFNSKFSHEVEISGNSYFNNCISELNTGPNHHKSIISIYCIEDNTYKVLYNYNQYGYVNALGTNLAVQNLSQVYFYAKANKTYIVKLKNNFNCTSGNIVIKYYDDNMIEQTQNQNLLWGGNRIYKTIDYANNNDNNPKIKKIYYAKHDSLNISSGIQGQNPFYLDISEFKEGNCFFSDIVANSSSITNLFDTNGSSIYYEHVIVADGENFDNGFEENEFIVNRDIRGQSFRGTTEIVTAPWSNYGWNNGKQKSIKIYSKSNDLISLIKEVNFVYAKDNDNTYTTNYSVRNFYPGVFSMQNNDACLCTISNINEVYTGMYCTTNHLHKKNSNNICIAPNASNVNYTINHPCFGKSIGQIVNIPSIYHLDIMTYKIFSYFTYLSQKNEIEYFPNGTITKNYTYSYNTNNYYLLSSEKRSTNNDLLETKYYYPFDEQMASEPNVGNLISKNMIGVPLKIENYRGFEKLSEQKTQYGIFPSSISGQNLILPEFIYSAKGSSALEQRIRFTKYDAYGNTLEVQQVDGTPISYIWGYHNTQPVAKIENLAYDAIPPYLITAIQSATDTGTESSVLTALNNLRNNTALANSMVTTLTYIPLVGVSTVTDPKGDTITYTYDSFGRLQFVKDKENNPLSENQYNYKP